MVEQNGSSFPMTLTYNDITLVSRVMSEVKSRSLPNTRRGISRNDTHLNFPFLAAPMDTVCNAEMAIALENLGGLGIIHRFQTIQDQVSEIRKYMDRVEQVHYGVYGWNAESNKGVWGERVNVAFSISAVDFAERLDAIVMMIRSFGTPSQLRIWICIDTANGFHSYIKEVVEYVNEMYKDIRNQIILIAGNVASKEGYLYLADLGVDIVRCGISNGSPCTTGIVTGVGQGIVSTILECVDAKKSLLSQGVKNPPLILADGSIQSSGDISKAIALGADLIMVGSMLAGFKESPAPLRKKPRMLFRFLGDWLSIKATGVPVLDWLLLSQDPKNWWKPYRGMASHTVNQIANKLNNTNKRIVAEGVDAKVPYTGSVYDGLPLIQGGVCSTMSYFNALDVETFVHNAQLPNSIVQQTYFSHIERSPFIKSNGW